MGARQKASRSFEQLTTTAGGGGGGGAPPTPLLDPSTHRPSLKDWAQFSSGPSANQKFSLAPLSPLKTQHPGGGVLTRRNVTQGGRTPPKKRSPGQGACMQAQLERHVGLLHRAASGCWVIYKILKEAGLPDGVLNFLPADGPLFGDAIFQHPGVPCCGVARGGGLESARMPLCLSANRAAHHHCSALPVSACLINGSHTVRSAAGFQARATDTPLYTPASVFGCTQDSGAPHPRRGRMCTAQESLD